jgi:hypothetical protein
MAPCAFPGALVNITLLLNEVNGSIADPAVMGALGTLHACGLRVLSLENNKVSGPLLPGWGDMEELEVLDLANNWLVSVE